MSKYLFFLKNAVTDEKTRQYIILFQISIKEQISLGNLATTLYTSLLRTDSKANFRTGPNGYFLGHFHTPLHHHYLKSFCLVVIASHRSEAYTPGDGKANISTISRVFHSNVG